MKSRKVLAIAMGMLLAFCNVGSIKAATYPPALVDGDLQCATILSSSLTRVQVSSSTYEYRSFGVFQVHGKCVINVYVQDTWGKQPMFAGKSNSFKGAVSSTSANSNIHQDNYSFRDHARSYYLIIK